MLSWILLTSLTAHAAPIAGHAWDPSQTITIEIPQTPPGGLTTEEFRTELDAVLAVYNGLACTNGLTLEWTEVEDPTETWPDNDGRAVLTHGDPSDEMSPGILSNVLMNRTGPLTHLDNAPVESVNGGTIAIGGNIAWTTSAKVEAGDCGNEQNIGLTLMFDVGAFLGLQGHHEDEQSVMYASHAACESIKTPTRDEIHTLRRLYGFRYDVHCTPAAATPPFDVSCEIRPLAGAAPATGIEWTLPDGSTSSANQVDLEVTELGEVALDVCFSSADCDEPMERCDHIALAGCGPLEAKGEWNAPDEPRPNDAGGYDLRVEVQNTTEGSTLCVESVHWTVSRASDGELFWESTGWDSFDLYLAMDELYLAELSLEGPNGPSTTVVEIDLRDDTGMPQTEPEADEEKGCGCATSGPSPALAGLILLLPLIRRRR